MAEPLLVVDVQKGFINEFTRHIPGRVRQLIESGGYAPLLFTRFVNSAGSPYQTLLDWHACAEPPETDLVDEIAEVADQDRVYDKHGLTGLPDALARHLADRRYRQITIVGIDTDMCVLKVALDVL